MTMEEAIQQLDGAEMMLLNREFIQFNQAIIMAISALRIQQKQEAALCIVKQIVGKSSPLTSVAA